MALSIKDPETERLARALAQRTGETLTVATRRALEERLRRIGAPLDAPRCSRTLRRSAGGGAKCRCSILAARTRSLAMTRTGCPADGDRRLGDCRHRVQRTRGRELRTPHRRCACSPDFGRDRAGNRDGDRDPARAGFNFGSGEGSTLARDHARQSARGGFEPSPLATHRLARQAFDSGDWSGIGTAPLRERASRFRPRPSPAPPHEARAGRQSPRAMLASEPIGGP